jgi:hypothetical protein
VLVLIDVGGRVYGLPEELATIVAEHLRAHPDARDPDSCITASDKLERALVGDETEPLTFTSEEAIWVKRSLEGPLTGHPDDSDLWALLDAL